MGISVLGNRFFDSTRGRIVALLRRGTRTVDELAESLGLTDNAVRTQLAALERDGLARAAGAKRVGDARKPSTLYELPVESEPALSSAYAPVLTALVSTIAAELPPEQVERLMRETGRRIARESGLEASGSTLERARLAADVLTALGGDLEVVRVRGQVHLRGFGCPLSATTAGQPSVCSAVETMIAELTGEPVRECCHHGERPRCAFAIGEKRR